MGPKDTDKTITRSGSGILEKKKKKSICSGIMKVMFFEMFILLPGCDSLDANAAVPSSSVIE